MIAEVFLLSMKKAMKWVSVILEEREDSFPLWRWAHQHGYLIFMTNMELQTMMGRDFYYHRISTCNPN